MTFFLKQMNKQNPLVYILLKQNVGEDMGYGRNMTGLM